MRAAAVTCASCGNLNPPDVACCLRCGHRLPQSSETRGDIGASLPASAERAPDRADISQFWVGSVINDRYRLERAIGEGGNGVVFAAVDLHLGREVALKVLHGDLATHEKALQRFKREALALARANHPNVVHIYDVTECRGQLVLVLELMRGGSLSSRIGRGDVPPDEAIRLVFGILAGLGAVHAQGFVHRDLKPANVLLSAHGEPKVADLGVVHETGGSNLTSTGVVIGTVAYMAPEQLTGHPVCPQTDLYAVGLILYELLSGREAFAGRSEYEVIQLHLRGTPDYSPLAHIPPEIVMVIQRALEKDVARRFASAEEFAQALSAAASMSLPPPGRLSNAPGLLGREPSGFYANRVSEPTPAAGYSAVRMSEPTNPSGYYVNRTSVPSAQPIDVLTSARPGAVNQGGASVGGVFRWIGGVFAAIAAVPLLIVVLIVGSAIVYLLWRLYIESASSEVPRAGRTLGAVAVELREAQGEPLSRSAV